MIYGNKIRLRAIERDDLDAFVRWFNDPEIRRYLFMYRPLSKAAEERWFGELSRRDPDEIPMAIETLDGVLIGNTAFNDIDWRNRSAEFGIVIGEKEYWNRGYGTDATLTMLRHGFGTLNMHRIFLQTLEYNHRAIRCYEKCGFRHEGTLRKAIYRDGEYHDLLMMSILRDEWDATWGGEKGDAQA